MQQLYATLIEGWAQAGGTVQCMRMGRIYLKFQAREHKFNLAVLAAPKGKRGPAIDVDWNLATRDHPYLDYVPEAVADFEATVSKLPGFEQQGTITRLVIGEAFQSEHADTLLKSMLALKAVS